MGLFGSVKMPATSAEEIRLGQVGTQMLNEGGAFSGMAQRRLADISDLSDERAYARGRANADTMQAVDASSMTPFQRAMAKATALSKISAQGDRQVESQALMGRMKMAALGSKLRAGTAEGYAQGADIAAEDIASRMQAEQIKRAATLNMVGSLAGMGAAAFGPKLAGLFKSNDAAQLSPGAAAQQAAILNMTPTQVAFTPNLASRLDVNRVFPMGSI